MWTGDNLRLVGPEPLLPTTVILLVLLMTITPDILGSRVGPVDKRLLAALLLVKTLPFGTESEIKYETENRIDLARKYGGLIISPSHDMPIDVPMNNIKSMVDILKSQ